MTEHLVLSTDISLQFSVSSVFQSSSEEFLAALTQPESLSDASIQATTANMSITIKHDRKISFLLSIT